MTGDALNQVECCAALQLPAHMGGRLVPVPKRAQHDDSWEITGYYGLLQVEQPCCVCACVCPVYELEQSWLLGRLSCWLSEAEAHRTKGITGFCG